MCPWHHDPMGWCADFIPPLLSFVFQEVVDPVVGYYLAVLTILSQEATFSITKVSIEQQLKSYWNCCSYLETFPITLYCLLVFYSLECSISLFDINRFLTG